MQVLGSYAHKNVKEVGWTLNFRPHFRIEVMTIIFLVFILPNPTFAQIYKWVNENGTVEFTDDPTKIPEKYRGQIEIKKEITEKPEGEIKSPKPADLGVTSQPQKSVVKQEQKPEDQISEEEKQKAEKETREVWEKMRKSLKGR
jgi:hypothetical protein